MRERKLLTGVVAVALCVLLGRIVVAAQDGDFKAPPPSPEMKELKGLVGTWDTQVKFYLDPSKPPQESTGTMKRALVMDGRFLEEKYEGKVGGAAFKGHGVVGFDTTKKMYSSFWVDSMSNNMMVMYGTYDEKTKTFTYKGEEISEFTKAKMKTRDVLRLVNNNEQQFEMFRTPEGGKEFKMMEIKYTRRAK